MRRLVLTVLLVLGFAAPLAEDRRVSKQSLGTPWCRAYILDPSRTGYVGC